MPKVSSADGGMAKKFERAADGDPLVVLVANGSSPHIAAWYRVLDERGIEWQLWDSHPTGSAVRKLWQLLRTFGPGRIRMRRLTRSRPVRVHSHGAGRASLLACLFVTDHPDVVVYGSEVIWVETKPWAQRQLIRWTLQRATIVRTYADSTWPHVRRIAPRVAGLETFHPGPDWSHVRKGRRTEAAPDTIQIFSIRRILPLYNIAEIITAFRALESSRASSLVLLQGDSPDGGDYLEGIRALVEASTADGSNESIELVTTFLGPEELSEIYRHSDIAISVASSDQLSSSVVEALGAGCILVASDLEAYAAVSGLPHFVPVPLPVTADGVADGLRRALALAMDGLGRTPEDRERLGELTRAAFEESCGDVGRLFDAVQRD